MIQTHTIVVVLLGLVVVGCQPTPEPPKPPASKPIPTPIPPEPEPNPEEPEPTPDHEETSPLHLAFQQIGGSISLHHTYFGAVLVSGRIPFYRIDDKGLTPDPSLAEGIYEENIWERDPIKSIHWDNSTSAELVARATAHIPILLSCKRQAKRWNCDRIQYIDWEGNPILVAPENSQDSFLGETPIPWGDRWVNGTFIFHKKYFMEFPYKHNYSEENITQELVDYNFEFLGYPYSTPSPKYRIRQGKHFAIEGARHAPMPVRSPQIPGCICASALCGEFRGKTFPKTREMIAVGRHCDGSLAVERWLPRKRTPIVEKLPHADQLVKRSACPEDPDQDMYVDAALPCPFRLIALSHNNIYVLATLTRDNGQPRPYLAHFDGHHWNDLSPQDAQGFVHGFQHDGDDLVLILGDNSLWFSSRHSPSWTTLPSPNAQDFQWLKRSPDGGYWASYGTELFHKAQEGWKKIPLPRSKEPTHKGERYNVVNIAWLPDGSPIVHGVLSDDDEDKHAEHVVLFAKPPQEVFRTSNLRQLQAPKVFGTVTIAIPQCGEAIFTILKKLDTSTPEDFPHRDLKNKLASKIRTSGSYELIEVKDGSDRYLILLTEQYNTWLGIEKGMRQLRLPTSNAPLCGNIPPIHRMVHHSPSDKELNEELMRSLD